MFYGHANKAQVLLYLRTKTESARTSSIYWTKLYTKSFALYCKLLCYCFKYPIKRNLF